MVKSTANDLLERENQAGNAEDSLSAGQKKYDSQFNRHANSQELDDEQIDTHGDKIQSNYNADEPDADIKNTKDQEESGGRNSLNYKKSESTQPTGRLTKLKKGVQKVGPSTGIAGFILAMFGGLTILLSPAALLVAIEKAVTTDGSDSSRTNSVMHRAYMGNILSKANKDEAPCSGAKIKCKFKEVGQRQLDKFKNLGFKMETIDGKDGRFKVKSIEYPDGKKVEDGKGYNSHADNNIEGRRSAGQVFNNRSAFFHDAKFTNVLKKFKLSKSAVLKSSNDRDKEKRKAAIDKSFNENTGSTSDKEGKLAKAKARIAEVKGKTAKFKGAVSKGLGASTALAVACAAYNTIRVTTATVKLMWVSDLIAFAFPFVQAASQIQDQGNIEPEVVENLGDRLTWYDNKKKLESGEANPKYNLTATDSQGLKAAIYGDFSELKKFTDQYTTGTLGMAVIGSQIVKSAQNTLGKDNIRDTCRLNGWVQYASSATCLLGPVGFLVCATAIIALAAYGDDIIGAIVDKLAEPAMETISNANLDSSLRGVDAGNALAAGIGLMLSYSSMGSGNRPTKNAANGGVQQVKDFITATDPEYNRQIELARYEAKDDPFNIYNQYSFAGSIATALNPYNSSSRTFFDHGANTLAVLTTPLSLISSSASALHSQPSQMTANPGATEGRMKNCKDPDMAEIKLGCDWSGRMIGYSSPAFLKMAEDQATGGIDVIDSVVDELIASEDIDDSGKPKGIDDGDIDKKSEYAKYREFCTDIREDPLGTTSRTVEEGSDDDQHWFDGSACAYGTSKTNEKRLDNFAFYFNWCERQFPAAEGLNSTNCWSESAVATTPATKNTGDWVIPTSGPCLSPYGQRWGALHAGIDISPPAGTPIVAPTSMKITKVSDTGDGYGTSITGTATDGSGNSFRLAHMIAGSPTVSLGQEVSKGEKIGEVGSTGDSTGPHLHFEIFPEGVNPAGYSGATDPVPVLAQHGVTISC